jgi:predicted transcriptional regulator
VEVVVSVSVIEREAEDDLSAEGEPLSLAEARRLTDQIREGLESIWELSLQAWQGQVWLALGYGSWEDYCTRELGTCRVKLPTDNALRAEVWQPLAEAGMSHKAIASVAGVSRTRVYEALRSEQGAIARVEGVDRKSYPASKPTRADVLIRQAKVAQLRNQGVLQAEIAQELGVAQSTVSADLARLDEMQAALGEEVDLAQVLQDSRDEVGRTDAGAIAQQLGVRAAPVKHLSKLVRQPAKDLEATLRVVVNEVVLADEWLDPGERAAALEVLMPTTVRVLQQLRQIVDAITEQDRQGEQWQALSAAISELEATGCRL